MSRHVLIAALLAGAAGLLAPVAYARAPAAVGFIPVDPVDPYTTAATPLGVLLIDPAAKAILVKYVPQIAAIVQTDLRSLTLKQLQAYAFVPVTDETLGKIDSNLSEIPAKF